MARQSAARQEEPGRPERELLSIGQVLNRLGDEFPDVTPSKVRFLEEQGLVAPSRTESGYRKFTAADVERLRLVLSLQRDHYLPLKVIRGYLSEIDAGGSPVLPGILPAGQYASGQQRAMTRDELREATGASSSLVTEAVSVGLLPAGPRYDDASLAVLRSLVALESFGIGPRHLRGTKAATDREAGLVQSAVAVGARSDDPTERAQAASDASTIADHLVAIKTRLLARALDSLEP